MGTQEPQRRVWSQCGFSGQWEGQEQGADCELTDLLSLFTRVGRKPGETGPSLCIRPQGKLCLLAAHPASSSLTYACLSLYSTLPCVRAISQSQAQSS